MVTHPPGTSVQRIPSDELDRLVASYQPDCRPEVRDRIAEAFEWLVMLCANRERWHDEPIDDLAQDARIGLLSAIDRFDPERGVKLRTFAEATIVGTIQHHHRSALALKVPRAVQDLNVTCHRAVERLTASLKRTPTSAEVAEHVGIGLTEVAAALQVDHLFHPMSLSCQLSVAAATALEEYLSTNDVGLESTPERAEVHAAMASLPSRQRTILFLHFFDGRTQAEIGCRMGISQVQVSRLMTAALEFLRDQISPPAAVCPNRPSRRSPCSTA